MTKETQPLSIKAHNQQQSCLYTLPAEIRLMILRQLLVTVESSDKVNHRKRPNLTRSTKLYLPIMQTCQNFYHESIDLLNIEYEVNLNVQYALGYLSLKIDNKQRSVQDWFNSKFGQFILKHFDKLHIKIDTWMSAQGHLGFQRQVDFLMPELHDCQQAKPTGLCITMDESMQPCLDTGIDERLAELRENIKKIAIQFFIHTGISRRGHQYIRRYSESGPRLRELSDARKLATEVAELLSYSWINGTVWSRIDTKIDALERAISNFDVDRYKRSERSMINDMKALKGQLGQYSHEK